MQLWVVWVALRKLDLMRDSCPRRPLRDISYGFLKLSEVLPSSLRVEPMATLIPSPRSTLHVQSVIMS